MLAEIQVSPRPYGTDDAAYANVHPALRIIQESGLKYEVHGLGTVVEGTPDEIWALLRRVHEAPFAAGAKQTASYIKVHQHADESTSPTIARLTKNWR